MFSSWAPFILEEDFDGHVTSNVFFQSKLRLAWYQMFRPAGTVNYRPGAFRFPRAAWNCLTDIERVVQAFQPVPTALRLISASRASRVVQAFQPVPTAWKGCATNPDYVYRIFQTPHWNPFAPVGGVPERIRKPPERLWKPPEPVRKPLEPTFLFISSLFQASYLFWTLVIALFLRFVSTPAWGA